jgi:ABC-2 type transport system permease protein
MASTSTRMLLLGAVQLFEPVNGPQWLQKGSALMPTKHVVDAVRNSFLGDISLGALGGGVAWTGILLAVSLWWGTTTFRRENA